MNPRWLTSDGDANPAINSRALSNILALTIAF